MEREDPALMVEILRAAMEFTEKPVTVITSKEVVVVDFVMLRAMRGGIKNIQKEQVRRNNL